MTRSGVESLARIVLLLVCVLALAAKTACGPGGSKTTGPAGPRPGGETAPGARPDSSHARPHGPFPAGRSVLLQTAWNQPGTVAFSKDGGVLAAGGPYGTITVFRLQPTGRAFRLEAGGEVPDPMRVYVGPKGSTLAAASLDRGALCVWRLDKKTGSSRRSRSRKACRKITGTLMSTARAQGGLMLAGLADSTAQLLNLKRKAPVKTFKLSLPSKVVRTAADPAGRWVALVDQVGGAEIFSVKSRERVATVRIPRRKIVALAFAPGGGDTMAVALTGGILQLRRLPFGDKVEGAQYRAPDALTSVAFSPDGRLLAAGCVDGRVRVFPAAPPWKKSTTLIAGRTAVTGVAFGGKDLLAAAQPGRGVHLWTRTGGRVLPRARALALPGPSGAPPPRISLPEPKTTVITKTGFDVNHWAVSCHSTLAAVTDGTKNVTMYDARNGNVLWKIRLPAWIARDPSAKIRLTFSPGANHLIGFHPTGWVFRWQTQLRRGWRLPIYRFTGLVSVLFAHNARSFLATRRTGRATLFTATGRRMGGFNGIPGAYWVAISPNGRTGVHIKGWDEIAAYRLPGGRRIWRKPSGRHKLYEVLAVNFSENSKTLRTYHASGFARLYDTRNGRLMERRLVKFPKDARRCSLRQDLEVLACAVGSEVHVKQIGTSRLIRLLTPPSGIAGTAVGSMAFNLHGEMLAAAYGSRTLVIWHFPPTGK